MELKIYLDYDQILKLIHQLPDKDIEKLAVTLQSVVSSKKPSGSVAETILRAPTWTDSELNEFQAARDHINKSRLA